MQYGTKINLRKKNFHRQKYSNMCLSDLFQTWQRILQCTPYTLVATHIFLRYKTGHLFYKYDASSQACSSHFAVSIKAFPLHSYISSSCAEFWTKSVFYYDAHVESAYYTLFIASILYLFEFFYCTLLLYLGTNISSAKKRLKTTHLWSALFDRLHTPYDIGVYESCESLRRGDIYKGERLLLTYCYPEQRRRLREGTVIMGIINLKMRSPKLRTLTKCTYGKYLCIEGIREGGNYFSQSKFTNSAHKQFCNSQQTPVKTNSKGLQKFVRIITNSV